MSRTLSELARTLTSTSPAPGDGMSRSARTRPSRLPSLSSWYARIFEPAEVMAEIPCSVRVSKATRPRRWESSHERQPTGKNGQISGIHTKKFLSGHHACDCSLGLRRELGACAGDSVQY